MRKSLAGLSRGEWLENRRSGIGGSDAPALVLPPDKFKWRRPRDVYNSKVYGSESEEKLEMRLGRYCEEFVAQEFTRVTGKRVQRYGYSIISDDNPFMTATIDRKLVGLNEGLECKTTCEYNLKRFNDKDYPYEYHVQCLHYLAVTGWDRWHLAVMIGNKNFRVYKVERDEEFIDYIISREREFWDIIKNKNERRL